MGILKIYIYISPSVNAVNIRGKLFPLTLLKRFCPVSLEIRLLGSRFTRSKPSNAFLNNSFNSSSKNTKASNRRMGFVKIIRSETVGVIIYCELGNHFWVTFIVSLICTIILNVSYYYLVLINLQDLLIYSKTYYSLRVKAEKTDCFIRPCSIQDWLSV